MQRKTEAFEERPVPVPHLRQSFNMDWSVIESVPPRWEAGG